MRDAIHHWRLAYETVRCWGASTAFVNIKDFIHSKTIVEAVVEPWAEMLERHHYRIVDRLTIATAGNRFGANSHRVDHEVVLVAERRAPDGTGPRPPFGSRLTIASPTSSPPLRGD